MLSQDFNKAALDVANCDIVEVVKTFHVGISFEFLFEYFEKKSIVYNTSL